MSFCADAKWSRNHKLLSVDLKTEEVLHVMAHCSTMAVATKHWNHQRQEIEPQNLKSNSYFFFPMVWYTLFSEDCKSVVLAQCFLWHLLNVSETRSMVMIAKNALNIRLISVPLVFQKMIALQNELWESQCPREKISPEFHYQKVIKNLLLF